MKRRNRRPFLLSLGIAGMVLAILITSVAVVLAAPYSSHAAGAHSARNNDDRAKTINGLNRIAMVGSTAAIVDAKGHTAAVDPNPYGVAIVPANMNMSNGLKAGDILVSNIGAQDKGNTVVNFPGKKGPGHLFNVMDSKGTMGPSGIAFNAQSGTVWNANATANDVQVFKRDGTVLTTITNPLFNHPWGMATNNGTPNKADGSVDAFFTTNVTDGTIDRIDIIPQKGQALPMFKVFQIGQFDKNGEKTKIGVTWLPMLKIKDQVLKDVLLAIDPANSRIAAFANSSTANTTAMKATDKGMTVFQGKPLNVPGGFAINPLNGDLLVVNLNDNNLVELNMTQGKAVGVKQVDNVPVDLQTGNGSALFGVVATKDARGNLVVYYTDDNTNTLNMLSN